MISMTYDQRRETFRFAWRKNPFAFAVWRRVEPRNEMGLERAALKWNRHREEPQGVERRPSFDGLWRRGDPGGSRGPTTPGLLRFARNDGRGSTQMQPALVAALHPRPWAAQDAVGLRASAEKLRKGGVKSLRSFARVNLRGRARSRRAPCAGSSQELPGAKSAP
jgi:hypothetical protein